MRAEPNLDALVFGTLEAGTLLKIKDKSFFVWFFRMPQWTPLAEKPFAAQTPPSITFIALSFFL